jgi:hypothetical protein
MSNQVVIHQQQFTMPDLQGMASAFAKSQLFGVKTPEQALALMLVAQAEGRHPASAARDYDIIQGRPSKKAEAMLRDFLANAGKVEWHKLDNTGADATFSHPAGGSVRINWDMERAKKAGLGGKDMWSKYPRQMFRSRCVSEGVRTVFPMATSGMYVPEEEADIERTMKDVTPPKAEKRPRNEPIAGPNPFDAPETVGDILDANQPPIYPFIDADGVESGVTHDIFIIALEGSPALWKFNEATARAMFKALPTEWQARLKAVADAAKGK